MIEVLPFRADLIQGMEVRDLPPEWAPIVSSPEYLQQLERSGPGYVLLIDGRPIAAIVFVRLLYAGVAEVVGLMSPEVEAHKRVVHRICKKCVEDVQREHGLHRIEARIPAMQIRNRRWAEALGMRCEGVASAFGPHGEDFVYYARVRKELICPH